MSNMGACPTCGALMPKPSLRQHRVEQHLTIGCPMCSFRCFSRVGLTAHYGTSHRSDALFPCCWCEEKFQTVRTLNQHYKVVHKQEHDNLPLDEVGETADYMDAAQGGDIQTVLDEVTKDKHGVTVIPPSLDFGVIDLSQSSSGDAVFDIGTSVGGVPIDLVEAKLSPKASGRASSSPFSVAIEGTNRRLHVENNIRAIVTFNEENVGIYEDHVEFLFEDAIQHSRFVIVRSIRAVVASSEYNDLLPKVVYFRKQRVVDDSEPTVVPGPPPSFPGGIAYVESLPWAPIPRRILNILKNGGSVAEIARKLHLSPLPPTFSNATYATYFKVLLWAEEYRCEADLGMYDLTDTNLAKENSLYYLAVPGLSENRPSLVVGDRIHVRPQDGAIQEPKAFEGYVYVVRKEDVGLKFDPSLDPQHRPTRLYNAHFQLNRRLFRLQHQALETKFELARLLCPQVADVLLEHPPDMLTNVHNPLIANNPAQLQAVSSIASLPPGSPPFIVFGPPGTGKTVTIVEAIRQLLDRYRDARILACAPSNSAADIIVERLAPIGKEQLFRFYAPTRSKDQVSNVLRDFVYRSPSGDFGLPPKFMDFRVVVTTCFSASIAYSVGVPQGHFSHIFVDEAGHAAEPEAIIGLKTMADDQTNVILSGDPKQLGPVVCSPVARRLGLEKSYLERIMERESHDTEYGYGLTVVQLVQNFRSHPAILHFPNERFYNNTLESHGDASTIDSYLNWPMLPNAQFPMVFHATPGKDDREAQSPSFFNVLEVLQVKRYVELLRTDTNFRISNDDIGIISPYHAQCMKIRNALRTFADGVKIGSVEEFQGQERRVIIISTVRSSRDFVEYDLRHTLGFVANPRRLNVALTRAQALVIILGDPAVLSLDPLWRSLLNYIHVNGGWRGQEPSWDTKADVRESGGYDVEAREAAMADMNDFARRMEELTLQGLEGEE